MATNDDKLHFAYANYADYYVKVDRRTGLFACGCADSGENIRDASISFFKDGEKIVFDRQPDILWEQPNFGDRTVLSVSFDETGKYKLIFTLTVRGIEAKIVCAETAKPVTEGLLRHGEEEDCFACNLSGGYRIIRAGVGPAVSKNDDTLFNRKNDSALTLKADKLGLSYSYEERSYRFAACGNGFAVSLRKDVIAGEFGIRYGCINKHNVFGTPPVGWMTWYALKFDACEEKVLLNAKWQRDHLYDFGANVIWVDWEWYHSSLSKEGPEGIHFFAPDADRYPHGLRYVSDKLRELGMEPVLWIGPTHEPTTCEFIVNNPDVVLSDEVCWCGKYIYDVTNEKYIDNYLSACCEQIKKWNYRAVKWDCLPVTLRYLDKFHEKMRHPEMSSDEALRHAVSFVRAHLGKETYMLSCAGPSDRAVTFAADIFDGARIGDDIFGWQDFVANFVNRIMRFYPLHNVMLYCDPDNLIVRPEFNSYDQAVSRASLVAIMGLPVTLGDNLVELPEERVEIIRRVIPALDAHPMNLAYAPDREGDVLLVNLCVSKSFGQWNVADILNTGESETEYYLDFSALGLNDGNYAVYSFWDKEFLGVYDVGLKVNLRPYASKVLSVCRVEDKPVLVSTSRHIGQGALEVIDAHFDENENAMFGISDLIKGDAYEIRIYDPVSEKLVTHEILPDKTGVTEWRVDLR